MMKVTLKALKTNYEYLTGYIRQVLAWFVSVN